MGLIDLAADEIGAVVTYLEMKTRPSPKPLPASPFRILPWRDVDLRKYRILFARVGARWLWYSRLAMSDEQLRALLGEVHVVLDRDNVEIGMIELAFRERECVISFLGLVPELAGRGHGAWLLSQTLALAWRKGIDRVRVNTCSLDHPAALPAYLKAGFKAYRRAFERFPDPRLLGLLPPDTAPQIPLLGS